MMLSLMLADNGKNLLIFFSRQHLIVKFERSTLFRGYEAAFLKGFNALKETGRLLHVLTGQMGSPMVKSSGNEDPLICSIAALSL